MSNASGTTFGESLVQTAGKSVVVVIGMRSSGAGMVARGLPVMGVDLGGCLMSPAPGGVDRGLCEDLDVNAINAELHRVLRRGRGDLSPVPREDLLHERHASLRLRAAEVLKLRLWQKDAFGMNHPRLGLFLPFWQGVFGQLQLRPAYIFVVRNPLGTARFLQQSGNSGPGRYQHFWLRQLLDGVNLATGAPRVVVDCDRLVQDPSGQLARIARVLGFADRLDPGRLAGFSRGFGARESRHMRTEPDTALRDKALAPAAIAAGLLDDAATDRTSLDAADVAKSFAELPARMECLFPAMPCRPQAMAQKDAAVRRDDSGAGRIGLQPQPFNRWIFSPVRMMRNLAARFRRTAAVDPFLQPVSVEQSSGHGQGIPAKLRPAGGVLPDKAGGHDWHATGADPRFEIKNARRMFRPGWHVIRLCMRSDVPRGNAKFYFDYGNGYREADSLTMLYASAESVERLLLTEVAPRKARFDPLECSGRFSIERLDATSVTAAAARDLMLRHLRNHLLEYSMFSPDEAWQRVRDQAAAKNVDPVRLLYSLYNETFAAYQADAFSPKYPEWIERVEAPEFSDTARIRAAQEKFGRKPLISVIMPTYNTGEYFLRRAVESVLAQSYPHWELCIADDASSEPHVRKVLEDYARADARIKVVMRSENGHISAASNSALEIAAGDFVALLDHDDELSPQALHFVAEAVNVNPEARILYSDEDKIDEKGERSAPHFKSDWNPELFFSQNYVSHLSVYHRDLVGKAGGFRTGVEGSQDQDLLLRCLPYVRDAEIVHIPKVLYHWRMFDGSTALDPGEKQYTAAAGIKALRDYFDARGRTDVGVEPGLAPNTYRVRYPVPQPEPLVSLLIPTRDRLDLLQPCVRSMLDRTGYRNYEIVILDNQSKDAATRNYFERMQAEEPRVRVLHYDAPFNFSAINNYGVRHARGELVGLINNDIEAISPGWLAEMVSHAVRPEIGCVGAKLYYADDTIQHAGVILGLGGVAGHSHKHFPRDAPGYFYRLKVVQNLSAVTAACLLVRKSLFEEVGGFEEAGLGVAFNDIDFCIRVREAGYRNLWTPYAELYHHESRSRGAEDTPERVERFNSEARFMQTRWGEVLRNDPCYSPNLTLTREDFSFRQA